MLFHRHLLLRPLLRLRLPILYFLTWLLKIDTNSVRVLGAKLSAEVEQFQQSFNPSSNTIDLTAQQHITENPSRANIDNATMGLDNLERPTVQQHRTPNPSRVNPSRANIDNASQGVEPSIHSTATQTARRSRNTAPSNRRNRRHGTTAATPRNRGRNFTDEMISDLLHFFDLYLPIHADYWERVSNALNALYSVSIRDGGSVKKKFQQLYLTK